MDPLSSLLSMVALSLIFVGAVPSAANSTFPTDGIRLVGFQSGNTPVEDLVGEFSVTARRGDATPVMGATVTVNFNSCSPDIRISRIQTFPGVSVLCHDVQGVVSAQTNNLGVATFRILGGAVNAGNGPGVSTKCAEIRANGVFFSQIGVAVLDQTGGLDGALPDDISVVLADINAGSVARRSDFNFDGAILPNDLALQIGYVNSGNSAQNTAALCP